MTRRMKSILTPDEPPGQEVGPRYAAVESEKQVVKKADAEPTYLLVCHPFMKKT